MGRDDWPCFTICRIASAEQKVRQHLNRGSSGPGRTARIQRRGGGGGGEVAGSGFSPYRPSSGHAMMEMN